MTTTTHTPDTGTPIVLPANLGEHRAAGLALRKEQTQHDRTNEAVRKAEEMLEAAQAAQTGVAQRYAARLFAAFAKGLDDLPDAERRDFTDEERQIGAMVSELPIQPEHLLAMREQVAVNAAALAQQWAALRQSGRALALQHLEDLVSDACNRLDDPRGQVFEIAPKLELIRDACAAHQAFRNAPAGNRQLIGIDKEVLPAWPTPLLVEAHHRGDPDMLAMRIDLPALREKWSAIAPDVQREPDEAKVAALVRDLQQNFLVVPYTHRERQLEWISYSSPGEEHRIRVFRRAEGAGVRDHERHELEKRIAEIDAAERELQAIRSQPH